MYKSFVGLVALTSAWFWFSAPVLAVSAEQLQLHAAGINWLDLEGISCDVTNTGGVFDGNSNAEITWNYLRSRGMTEIQTAGFMGNFAHESGFDPTALNTLYPEPERQAFGLAQWLGSRKATLYDDYAPAHPLSVDSLDLQLDYVWWELTGEEPIEGLISSQTWTWDSIQEDIPADAGEGLSDSEVLAVVEDAAVAVEQYYERALGSGLEARKANAVLAYQQFATGEDTVFIAESCDTTGLGVAGNFVFPIKGTQAQISWCGNSFGNCHGTAWVGTYYAYDIWAYNNAPIVAVQEGTIVGFNPSYNCSVTGQLSMWINTDDGNWFFYQHLDASLLLVSNGERVSAGQVIGRIGPNAYVGGTCTNTSPHLHFAASTKRTSMYRGCTQSACPDMDGLFDVSEELKASYDALPES